MGQGAWDKGKDKMGGARDEGENGRMGVWGNGWGRRTIWLLKPGDEEALPHSSLGLSQEGTEPPEKSGAPTILNFRGAAAILRPLLSIEG
jgi:hypothetical protein